jgi:putative addiction module component (TIGR02574 family)
MSDEEFLAHVLGLPRGDRARIAEEILASLEEPEDDVALAWADELKRRSRQLADGSVTPVPWETARAQILADLKLRRRG